MGRPRVLIDLEKAKLFAKIQCTDAELAAVLDVSLKTVRRRLKDNDEFRELVEQGRSEGLSSLRRAMWQTALGGNPTMQIWLSKNHLGMKEPMKAIEVAGPGGQPVSLTWKDIATRAAGREHS